MDIVRRNIPAEYDPKSWFLNLSFAFDKEQYRGPGENVRAMISQQQNISNCL